MSAERLDILLIEDDEDDYVLVRDILAEVKDQKYRLDWRSSFEEALRASESGRYDAYLLDYKLGEHDGLQFLHEMNSRGSKVPIILLTGQGNYEIDMEAMRSGASDYLVKSQIGGPLLERSIRYAIERKKSEERLCISEERYRQIIESRYYRLVQNVPMVIFRLSGDLSLQYINHACKHVLGYTPHEAMQSNHWFLNRVCSEDRTRVRELLESAFGTNGCSFNTECRLFHKNGHAVYVLLKSISCSDCSLEGEPDCIEGILVDITDRVLLEKTLVQTEKLKTLGTIAAEVAHEIRNPLVCIGGFARRLQKRFPDTPEAGVILRESERLERILDRIRDYLTPVRMVPRECFINKVILQCLELLSPKTRAKRVTCRTELNEKVPSVLIDPDILAQVCINLLNNAISAVKEGAELVVRTSATDQNVSIDFENPVIGSRLKSPELLFLPFDAGGESVGLPLCYQLLKKMGGLLSFAQESDHVVFTVSIPRIRRT